MNITESIVENATVVINSSHLIMDQLNGIMDNDSISVIERVIKDHVMDEEAQIKTIIRGVREGFTYIIALITMFAMGAGVTMPDLKHHLLKPVGVTIGMVCQFLIMPFSAFCIIKIFDIQGAFGTGVLLISCCPGGTISNVFAYFADGDISLSVAMTTISCVAALFAMPGNLWLYGHFVNTGEVIIPYGMISLSLALTIPPAALGFLFRQKWPKLAPMATKIGSSLGLVLIAFVLTLHVVDKPDIYITAPWQLYAAVILLPPVGLIFAYLLSWVCKRPPAVRRTVAIEASIQNVGVALAVANLSFDAEIVRSVIIYPSLYCVTMMITGMMVAVAYRVQKRVYPEERLPEERYMYYWPEEPQPV